MYILWSTRSGGWLSKTATYTTTQADAQPFTEADMLTHCKRHATKEGLHLIPVRLEDLEKLK